MRTLWASSQFGGQPEAKKGVIEAGITIARDTDVTRQTREVDMKKSFFLMLLAASLGACSIQQPVADQKPVLLSFTDLATEITVGYQAGDLTVVDDDKPALIDTP